MHESHAISAIWLLNNIALLYIFPRFIIQEAALIADGLGIDQKKKGNIQTSVCMVLQLMWWYQAHVVEGDVLPPPAAELLCDEFRVGVFYRLIEAVQYTVTDVLFSF